MVKWSGNLKGKKGYKSYKFLSSIIIRGTTATANFTKEGLFRFEYRVNTPYPLNKKDVASDIRDIIHFEGRYLLIIDRIDNTNSIEFYCKMNQEPSEEIMINLETFLHTL